MQFIYITFEDKLKKLMIEKKALRKLDQVIVDRFKGMMRI